MVVVSVPASLSLSLTHTHVELQIGFKNIMYSIGEEQGYFSLEVEVKNNGVFAIPIDFTVTDTEGGALSKFSNCLIYDKLDMFILLISGAVDYIGLGTVTLQLQPGQTSVQYNVTIVDDSVTEVDQETFTLNLNTNQARVTALAGSNQAVVTITDDDRK